MEQRAVIKFHAKLGTSATETFKMMQKAYGSECLSRSMTFEWHKRFLEGRQSLEDDERLGRPISIRTADSIRIVQEFVSNDRNATLRMMEDALDMSKETIRKILKEDLGKTKVCAKFVPHTLTEEQRLLRVRHAREIMRAANKSTTFLKSIVTGGETWCFQYDPETKCQSAEWKSKSSPQAKKTRKVLSKVKAMLIVFFDCKGIIHHEFVPDGQTITGDYYLEALQRLLGRIRRIRPEYRDPGDWCLLLHDNAPSHTSLVVRQFLARNQVCVLNHSPYSPDLAPCDFALFPKMKMKLKGCVFDDIEAIKSASTSTLEAIPKTEHVHTFESLLSRCKKCIESEGEYFE